MFFTVRLITLLIFTTLDFWDVFAARSPSELSRLGRTSKRSLDSWVSVNSQGSWPCSYTEIEAIENAVEYAKILANAAVVALDDTGTSSKAYLRWFGDSNAQESAHRSILVNHYEAVIKELRAPESGTVESLDEGGPNPRRLVYACPRVDNRLCLDDRTAAAVVNAGDQGFYEVNLLFVCPRFFLKVRHSQMLSNWRKGEYTSSAGLVLLHEMQHLDAVVGKDRRCDDLAYSVNGCENLDDDDKLRNAQNYAFFALDVTAVPPS